MPVRPARPDDAGALGDLLTACVGGGASVGFLDGLTSADAAAWWRTALADPAWVACDDAGRIVGVVRLVPAAAPNGRHRAEVTKLLVHPAARRRGYASALLAALEDAARDRGHRLLVLDTETGSPAEAMYQRLGWRPVGTVPDYAARPDGRLAPTTIMYRRLDG